MATKVKEKKEKEVKVKVKVKKTPAPKKTSGPTKKTDSVKKARTLKKTSSSPKMTGSPKKKGPKEKPSWYVIMAQSGHEQKIAEAIKQRVEATGLQKTITEVLVPVQKKIIVKEGKQTIKEERIFPGYVLLKMILDQKTWEIITNTEGVAGFVRTTKHPRPLPEEEVQAIMKFMELEQPAFQATFNTGDAVKITDGAFADFVGSVSNIDDAKGKVKVLISIFGRETPVELEFDQVKKL